MRFFLSGINREEGTSTIGRALYARSRGTITTYGLICRDIVEVELEYRNARPRSRRTKSNKIRKDYRTWIWIQWLRVIGQIKKKGAEEDYEMILRETNIFFQNFKIILLFWILWWNGFIISNDDKSFNCVRRNIV